MTLVLACDAGDRGLIPIRDMSFSLLEDIQNHYIYTVLSPSQDKNSGGLEF
jgi:hypothetical protein